MSWEPDNGPIEYRRAFCSLGGLSGGPSGSYSGSGIGAPSTSTASVYAPTGQSTADLQSQNVLTGLYDLYPQLKDLSTSYSSNPYYSQALTGAQTGAGYGADTAATTQGLSSALVPAFNDTLGYAKSAAALAPSVAAPMSSLQGASKDVLSTAFDPQSSLYSRGLQSTTDSANAINSMYGVGSSPYGAGLTSDAVRNYNIDWQDKLLGRETKGLQSAALGDVSAGQLGTASGDLYKDAGSLDTTAGTLGKDVYGLGYDATGLASSAAALPSQSYVKNLGDKYTGLSDVSKYGTNLYDDLASYLGIGQKASTISGDLGSLGTSQKSSALSGLGDLFTSTTGGTAGNLLFGSGGLSGALGLGSGGIFGDLFSLGSDFIGGA